MGNSEPKGKFCSHEICNMKRIKAKFFVILSIQVINMIVI